MSEAELYRKAAAVLRRDGWCQVYRTNERGQHCLFGALDCAAGNDFTRMTDEDVPTLSSLVDCVVEFNDFYCETVDDAVAALLIAADLATPAPEQS